MACRIILNGKSRGARAHWATTARWFQAFMKFSEVQIPVVGAAETQQKDNHEK